MLEWIKNHDSTLAQKSRAKLYVAITRAKYSVAFVDNKIDAHNLEIFNRWE